MILLWLSNALRPDRIKHVSSLRLNLYYLNLHVQYEENNVE